jgi:hypothetical protein
MLVKVAMQIFFLVVQTQALPYPVLGQDGQSGDYGPAVRAYLDYLRAEEEELEFHIQRNEITHKGYTRARNKIAILRQTILDLVKETGEDRVPELHVVSSSEVHQLIEDGEKALRGVKAGDAVEKKWIYRGRVARGEVYYIFERVPPAQ